MKFTEDVDKIHAKDIPKAWVHNVDYTMYRLVALLLRKYLCDANEHIYIPSEDKVEIENIIKEAEALNDYFDDLCNGEEIESRTQILFTRLGKILPRLWY